MQLLLPILISLPDLSFLINLSSLPFLLQCLQFVASAPTLFPAEYVAEFQNCFDRAPEVPFKEIEAILRKELGRPLDSIYEYVDPVPIASASIAQVCI
jgi:predicted unusual protein kinase regulating ubiquinone biosynthesis (AarF/ABC1/UbiB family)